MMKKADSALWAIPTPGRGERDEWVRLGQAYQAAGGEFPVWDEWSKCGGGYNAAASRQTWQSFKPDGGITGRTLYQEARKHGWKDEGSSGRHSGGRSHAGRSDAGGVDAEWVRGVIVSAREKEKSSHAAREYLKGRGFSDETITRFNPGYNPEYCQAGTKEARLILPYPGDDYFTARRLSEAGDRDGKKYLYPPKAYAGKKRAFNTPALKGGAAVVFIVEGQLDAMSLEQCGGAAVGSNEPGQILDALEQCGGAGASPAFLVVPDADGNGAGAAKAAKMLDALKEAGQEAYTYALPDGIHDVNEWLAKAPSELKSWVDGAAAFLDAAREADRAILREEFEKQGGAGRISAFIHEIVENGTRRAIPTGFVQLDEVLDGGLYPGLYVIGAISSLGKTTFALQAIDHMAAAGVRCLVFSLEMAASELMAKSLSRLTERLAREDGERKTARTILAGRTREWIKSERELLKDAIREYETFAGRVFIVEGVGGFGVAEVREKVGRFVAAYGEPPVVLVDYLQILSPADARATDKQNADRAVTELKRIARDYKTPVVAISSFNRDSYSTGASMSAFKESGAIEYSSDVLLALQLEGVGARDFDVDAAKREIPRKVELCILKNRNGRTGARIPFDFDARFNVFRERAIAAGEAPRRI